VLESIESFYASSANVDRADFRSFVSRLIPRHPGIQALEWVPRVPEREREAYEAVARKEGFPGFQFTERDAQDQPVRAGTRSEYYPVYFVEPWAGNEAALGFDIGSRSDRLEALERARDTGQPASTGRIRLVQGDSAQFGTIVAMPIYEPGSAPDTLEDRRRNLRGFAVGAFQLNDMVSAALRDVDATGIDLRLREFAARAPALQTGDLSDLEAIPAAARPFVLADTFEIAGRLWELRFVPTNAYLAAHRAWQAWGVLATGLSFTGLLGAFLLVVTGRSMALQELIAIRTADLLQANEDLQASERRTRQIIDTAHDAFIAIDSSGRITDWNPRAVSIFGWKREEVLGRSLSQTIVPLAYRDAHEKGLRHFLTTREGPVLNKQIEITALRRSGEEFPVELTIAPVRVGEEYFFGAFLRDISERKAAEAALRASEEQFAKVFHASPLALGISTLAEGRFIDVNEACLGLFGRSRTEVIGQSAAEIGVWNNPEDRARLVSILKQDQTVRNLEIHLRKKSGEVVQGLSSAELIDLRGEPCIVSIVLDITERKQAEAALQQSQALYHSLVEALPVSVWRKDLDGRFTFANRRFCEVLCKTTGQILGQTVFDFHNRELAENHTANDRAVIETGIACEGIEEYATDSGSNYNHIIRVPLRDREGRIVGIQGIFTDVTESKRAEEALRVSEERFRQLSAFAPIGIFHTDVLGLCRYTNPHWQEITGLTLAESLGDG
jgi:PAS domain S-box-containing protein